MGKPVRKSQEENRSVLLPPLSEGSENGQQEKPDIHHTPPLMCTKDLFEQQLQPVWFPKSYNEQSSTAMLPSVHTCSFREQQKQDHFTVFFFLNLIFSLTAIQMKFQYLRKETNCLYFHDLKENVVDFSDNSNSIFSFFHNESKED